MVCPFFLKVYSALNQETCVSKFLLCQRFNEAGDMLTAC